MMGVMRGLMTQDFVFVFGFQDFFKILFFFFF